ncbi:MAG: lactate racemase domain-containing protein [Candidatus Zixiibacteriota bacterium]
MPKVAYGDGTLEFELMPGDELTEASPVDDYPDWDTDRFRQRLEATDFERFVSFGRVLIVVNDAFRPTPTGTVLSQLKKLYPDIKADFIVACGNHPPPDDDDLNTIFEGFDRPTDSQLIYHNSRDYDDMVQIGESDDFRVYLNKAIFDYPAVITIGSVEPHYFAGYTGGRKSLIPGLSDIETNRRNHAKAVSLDARPMRLKGNPVAEDLDKLIRLGKLPELYSIQIVNGPNRNIIDCFGGSLHDAFAQAVAVAETVYCFKASKAFDLVIAEMRPPLDRNLYQMQKAVENCAEVVADSGTIIAVSSCRDGVGNSEFLELAKKLGSRENALKKATDKNPPLGIHKLSRIVGMAERIRVKALTGVEADILESVFFEPATSLNDELDGLRQVKKKLNILLVRDAGLLVAKLDF